MAAFADKDFASRLGSMGDEAEGVFEQVYEKGWVRWGFNRPPISVASLATKVRYAPDYITSDGFVECMGFGKAQVLRLKVEKHIALLQWHQEMPTRLFVWDGTNQRYTYVTMDQLTDSIGDANRGFFPEGKQTWDIPIDALGGEWVQKS